MVGLTPAQHAVCESAPLGVRRHLVAEPDFELHYNSYPPASSRTDGIASHGITVHCSSNARYVSHVDGRRFDAHAAAGLSGVIPATVPFNYEWADPIDLLLIWITPRLWQTVLEESVPGGAIDLEPGWLVADPLVAQIGFALKRGAELGQPFGRLLQDSLLVALIAHIANRQTSAAKVVGPRGGLVDWRLRKVLEYMENHFSEDITLAELAAIAGLSEHHFSKAFRQTMGEPPHRYLVQRRIARAKGLLDVHRGMSVTQVAMSVGFTTSTHFATMFRKFTGGSPSEYRDSL